MKIKVSLSKKHLSIIVFAGVLLSLSSCHSKYINIKNEICRDPVWNDNKTAVAFVSLKTVYRKPVGIARFPDGGMPKFEYSDLNLYSYNIIDKQLIKAINFNDLVDNFYPYAPNYRVKIAFTDSLVYYYFGETSLKWFHIDSLSKVKYSKYYLLNINTNKINEIDTAVFNSVYQKTKDSNKISSGEIHMMLSELPFTERDLEIQNLYPLSDKDYIDYIIYMEGNPLTRELIVKQIIPQLSKKQIQHALQKMDRYKDKLDEKAKSSVNYKDNCKKSNYDKYYEETYKKLKHLQ
ncbi:MAG: hypothetical protein IMY71_07325 [Bacteroidetes bacterium]|nr:hypothetical protein [Bacteroidota bacterium]